MDNKSGYIVVSVSLTGVEVGEAILGPVLSCPCHSHTLVCPTVQTLDIIYRHINTRTTGPVLLRGTCNKTHVVLPIYLSYSLGKVSYI